MKHALGSLVVLGLILFRGDASADDQTNGFMYGNAVQRHVYLLDRRPNADKTLTVPVSNTGFGSTYAFIVSSQKMHSLFGGSDSMHYGAYLSLSPDEDICHPKPRNEYS